MVPTFGRLAMLGSNPIAIAMPAEPYDFFFDASTTVVTRGKLEIYNKLSKPLPEGWALNADGKGSSDAQDVLKNIVAKKGGGIVPLGGETEQKGSLLIEAQIFEISMQPYEYRTYEWVHGELQKID